MNKSIKVKFQTDNGFFGRQCNSLECGKYFKINNEQIKNEMFCPYCGEKFENKELWTNEQISYARKIAVEETRNMILNDKAKIFSDLAGGNSGMTYKKGYRRLSSTPIPIEEKKVDCKIMCPDCSTDFQVYGIFGYCPVCREENMMIYDTNIKIIKEEIKNSNNPNRALRHAYKDLVSTFEFYCHSVAKKLNLGYTNFQEIKGTRQLFKKSSHKIDIYTLISNDEKLKIKRVFNKRHAYEHNSGIISEKYVKKIPEDKILLGTKAVLSLAEFEEGSIIVRKLLSLIVQLVSE